MALVCSRAEGGTIAVLYMDAEEESENIVRRKYDDIIVEVLPWWTKLKSETGCYINVDEPLFILVYCHMYLCCTVG